MIIQHNKANNTAQCLTAIHLLMVVKVQHIQLCGIDEVLSPVTDDLKTLKKVRGQAW